MGQKEISEILEKKSPDFVGMKEIMLVSGLTRSSVSSALRKMRKRQEIEYKIIAGLKPRSGWVTLYRTKKTIRRK